MGNIRQQSVKTLSIHKPSGIRRSRPLAKSQSQIHHTCRNFHMFSCRNTVPSKNQRNPDRIFKKGLFAVNSPFPAGISVVAGISEYGSVPCFFRIPLKSRPNLPYITVCLLRQRAICRTGIGSLFFRHFLLMCLYPGIFINNIRRFIKKPGHYAAAFIFLIQRRVRHIGRMGTKSPHHNKLRFFVRTAKIFQCLVHDCLVIVNHRAFASAHYGQTAGGTECRE